MKPKKGFLGVYEPDLRVELAGLTLRNPVMVASGTFGYGPEYAEVVDLESLGALVVKGLSIESTMGNPPPRTCETVGGLLNAIGLQNPGIHGFIAEYLPFLRRYDLPVIVNIWGRTQEEYAAVARACEGVSGIHALEVNVSCPNVKVGGHTFGTDPLSFQDLLGVVRAATSLPLIIKLAPNVPNIGCFARLAQAAGADALSLINSLPAMAIDIEARRPVLGNVTGGLTGPAIHPVAVKLVWDAAQAVDLPIIGMGGIDGPTPAIEFLLAGATAVAVGTSNFTDPGTVVRVVEGLRAYLKRHGFSSVRDIVGAARVS